MNLIDDIKNVKKSIVAVGTLNVDQLFISGSGFCVKDSEHILTSDHLIQNFSQEQLASLGCMIVTGEGAVTTYSWFNLDVFSRNPENDIAVLRLKPNHSPNLLQPLEIELSNSASEGQDVYFIGFPYAANLLRDGFGLTLIINKGIISSIKRKAQSPNPLDWYIIDAISNPGNSGCPLIDIASNKVIGIMSISFRTASQINPALDIREPMHIAGAKPISLAESILSSIV
jgi:S1-C subfamily serine protease